MDYPTPLLVDGVWLIYAVLLALGIFLVVVLIKALLLVVKLLRTMNAYWHLKTEAKQNARTDRFVR